MKASLPYKYITSVKNGRQYVVFDYKDNTGKRKRKWASTGLPEKCTKKALNEAVEEIAADFADKRRNRNFKKSAILVENLVEIFGRSQLYDLTESSSNAVKSDKNTNKI